MNVQNDKKLLRSTEATSTNVHNDNKILIAGRPIIGHEPALPQRRAHPLRGTSKTTLHFDQPLRAGHAPCAYEQLHSHGADYVRKDGRQRR